MALTDLINRLRASGDELSIRWVVDPAEGVDFVIPKQAQSDPEARASDSPLFGFQLAYLKGLLEQGAAVQNADGFTALSETLVTLDEDFANTFDLPEMFDGRFQARFEGNTGQAAFSVALDAVPPGESRTVPYKLWGPFIRFGETEYFRLSPVQWQALTAVAAHQSLADSERTEYENNWLVFQLQVAKKAGVAIDLSQFDKLEIVHPESIGVAVEELENGDLQLSPTYGPELDLADTKSRLGQIRDGDAHCILRVKNRFVLLDKERLEATEEILTNRRIPKSQVTQFLKAPTAYLDASLIDLDTGFSLRVHGAERFTHRYFGDVEASGIDWFSGTAPALEPISNIVSAVDSDEQMREIENLIGDALEHGADTIEVGARQFDLSDPERVATAIKAGWQKRESLEDASHENEYDSDSAIEPPPPSERAVIAIDSNDEELEFSKEQRLPDFDLSEQRFSEENLKRNPFPHQDEGIRWLLAHLESAVASDIESGALLADDMGLGKTFMTLVGVEEWYRRCERAGRTQKPTLIVAPLSLLENWQAEVEQTFLTSPFSDLVILQSGASLRQYKVVGSGRETQQIFSDAERITEQDEIRYSLKVGRAFGSERLDMPGRLVLTTYQTLRDYQFSLSRVDWGVVAFDEAQNIKNPNTLATRAAKGLKADFKLLATGTPVENSLKDFWCLMDTASPGLLGAWQEFRSAYIAPIASAEGDSIRDVKISIGAQLRAKVGHFMLRRTKAEELEGLPSKYVYSGDKSAPEEQYLPSLAATMKGAQLQHYDQVIEAVRSSELEDRRRLVLPSLLKLKITSIHHALDTKEELPRTSKALLAQAKESAKIQSMMATLKEISDRGEKVIVFATSKSVQAYVSMLVASLFGVRVDIINGDTKAIASKKDAETRKGIIDRFQQEPGFGVIVMSPVAAGVGLTVVGANNVLHLERHWNPAKEAQATDRVYRIGQARDVHVYVPMSLHPGIRSFDEQLNALLSNKVDLSDAVVAPAVVDASDLDSCF